jgi:copper chaperone NosL
MKLRWTGTLLLGAMLAWGCGQPETDGPPNVRYGQDECIHCGMILSEERHTAAIVHLVDGDRRESLLFDDIGDLIDYEIEHPELRIHRRYVHDLDTKQWLDASAAAIVHAPGLHTPMGSGLAAFASRESASAAVTRLSAGQVLDWPGAVTLRIAQKLRKSDGARLAREVADKSRSACCSGGEHDSQSSSGTADR